MLFFHNGDKVRIVSMPEHQGTCTEVQYMLVKDVTNIYDSGIVLEQGGLQ